MPEYVAFETEHHELIGTTEFDFDSVDEALGFVRESPPEAREQAAELFRQLIAWCFRGDRPISAAMVKFTAIACGLRPDLLGNLGLKELATELGVTKQALSRQSTKFEDAFGIKFARSRSPEARERMAAVRRGGPNRNIQHEPTNSNATA